MPGTYFIPVAEALKIVLRTVKSGPVVDLVTENVSGFVLAKTLKSPFQSPLFDHSAMDGYAFRFKDISAGKSLRVIGTAAAGNNFRGRLGANEAIRIFTGAAIPPGADTVVMQEKITIRDSWLHIDDDNLFKGANIRKAGSQLKKNQTAVAKGTFLNAGTTGFIAALGIDKVKVFKLPSVAVIITGDELIPPGHAPNPGQIFESNSVALISLLKKDGIQKVRVFRSCDTFTSVRNMFYKAFAHHDFVLFTGGISVGDFDFVGEVMKSEKVKTGFYKVKQKPGKPLYFGSKTGRYIFGLPGNPASVITCYYEFVLPALKKFMGHPNPMPITLSLPLKEPVRKKPGLTHFLKAYTDYKTVTPLPGQESYILKSFVPANCLMVLDEETESLQRGDKIDVHLI